MNAFLKDDDKDRLEKRLNVTTLKDYLLQYKEELKNIENLIKL